MRKVLMVLVALVLTGCKTHEKVVTVPEVHEHWHHTTDTIKQTDSIFNNQTTIIREVDSATMAQFGIQLKDMQSAWLIERQHLQREVSKLQQSRTDTIVERDSIPVPYPVEVEKERELTWWQRVRLTLGNVMLTLMGVGVVLGVMKLKRWI